MRVIHVSAYFAPAYRYGGPVRTVLALCQALQRRGVEIEAFTTTADGPADLPAHPGAPVPVEGVPVRRVRAQTAGTRRWEGHERALHLPEAVCRPAHRR